MEHKSLDKSVTFRHILAITPFFYIYWIMPNHWIAPNIWIKTAMLILCCIMSVLLVIWYIYLCVTPSVNEKIEKRMRCTIVTLQLLCIILMVLTCI
jgi:hypothetical protein